MKRKPKGWHPEDIKAAVRKRGKTFTALAREHEVDPSTPRLAASRPCYTGEQIVAGFLGIPPQELWPDRYSEDGHPLHPRVHLHNKRSVNASQRQTGAVK
jgi:Ner family transcriptional regulator